MDCLLCHSVSLIERQDVFSCSRCGLVFKNPSLFLTLEEDFKRYSSHQNNNQDPGYIHFLERLLNPMIPFLPEKFTSLDYGCGPGPTLSSLLKKKGGIVFNYDLLFYPDNHLLEKTYDVVTSTEVVEHFKNPDQNWEELISLVKPGGVLGIMTQFLTEEIVYQSWWYKNDPTHVTFYNVKTFDYLATKYNLEEIYNDQKAVVIFRKK